MTEQGAGSHFSHDATSTPTTQGEVVHGVSLDPILSSLAVDSVYIDADFPAPSGEPAETLRQDLERVAEKHGKESPQDPHDLQGKVGSLKLAYLARTDLSPTAARDVAQHIKDSTGANTVIVQTSNNGAVVADHLSRYALESHTSHIHGKSSAAQIEEFLSETAHSEPPTHLVNAGVLTGTVGAAALVAACVTWFNRRAGR